MCSAEGTSRVDLIQCAVLWVYSRTWRLFCRRLVMRRGSCNRLCCVTALQPSLVGAMQCIMLLRLLETKVPCVAGRDSELSLSMTCANWSL